MEAIGGANSRSVSCSGGGGCCSGQGHGEYTFVCTHKNHHHHGPNIRSLAATSEELCRVAPPKYSLHMRDAHAHDRLRVRFQIIGNACIKNVGKSQSCMVSKLPIIWKQTVILFRDNHTESCTTKIVWQRDRIPQKISRRDGVV